MAISLIFLSARQWCAVRTLRKISAMAIVSETVFSKNQM